MLAVNTLATSALEGGYALLRAHGGGRDEVGRPGAAGFGAGPV